MPHSQERGSLLLYSTASSALSIRRSTAVGVALVGRELWMAALAARTSFKNEVVVITGGGSGIGRIMALLFAREGAKVALWDLNLEACQVGME